VSPSWCIIMLYSEESSSFYCWCLSNSCNCWITIPNKTHAQHNVM
jgi:hypothetical protein